MDSPPEIIELSITDNNNAVHVRNIDRDITYCIPVINNLLNDVSSQSNITKVLALSHVVPLKLPEYTDIEDFDEFIDTLTNSYCGNDTSFRLMGPAMIASFLGINFNLELNIDDNIYTKYDLKTISEKLCKDYDIITEIKYKYPYIKFRFNDDKYKSRELLDYAIDMLISIIVDCGIDCKIVYPGTEHGGCGSGNRQELWMYVKSRFLNYIPTSLYISSTHKTITNDTKYPFGKQSDYQLLCTITKDHVLYHISRDFVESLINDQWRWKYFNNETFEQVTKVIAHFKKLNNLSWD